MIGDRSHDVVRAKSNGMDAIGVTYGYGSPEELIDGRRPPSLRLAARDSGPFKVARLSRTTLRISNALTFPKELV